MSLKSNVYRVVLGFLLVFSMSVFAFADTIRLKDGSIIKGKIINFGEGKFVVLIGEGPRQRQMSFFADEVEAIEFDGSALPPTNVKTSLPTNTNTAKKEPTTPVNNPSTDEPRTTPSKTVIITDPVKPSTTAGNTSVPPKTVPSPTNTNPPQIITNQPVSSPSNTTPTPKTDNASKAITLNVKVLADNTANGWTNSGWVVRKGQRIRVTGTGRISLGNGRFSAASGVTSLPDKDKLVQSEATGGLIAVIGDDNNEFIFIGAQREFTAARDGALFLGINEGNLEDNSGSFEVTVEILP